MQSAPSGTLRVSIATDFGVNHISPILGRFLHQYPEITVNMELNNRYVELISEGFDMAIRVGELEDSSLRARKICETTQRMIGSPAYFQTYGKPKRIDDLNDHKLLHYSNSSSSNVWKITAPSGEQRQVRTSGTLTVNDGQSLLNAAIGGLGIAYLPSFLYAEAMREGLLEDAIPDLPVEVLGIYAVYPPGRFIQPKVRSFIDFPRGSVPRQGSVGLVDRRPLPIVEQNDFDPPVGFAPLGGFVRGARSEKADAIGVELRGVHAQPVDQVPPHGIGARLG
jgi:DNA-binding transcriptional LysR family regulator